MLAQRWPIIADGGPALKRHWVIYPHCSVVDVYVRLSVTYLDYRELPIHSTILLSYHQRVNQCWSTVYNAGPTLHQPYINFSRDVNC